MKRAAWAIVVALALGAPAAAHGDEAGVRREIESRYQQLAAATGRHDLKSVLSFRTKGFYSIGPDGRLLDSKMMEEYSRGFFTDNKPPVRARFEIRKLTVSPNETVAVATVFQEVSRKREQAGKLRQVETSAVQDETWVKTPRGWLMESVRNVRDQVRVVDGVRVNPTKPYDPAAPPFDPDADRRANLLVAKADVAYASARENSVGVTAWKLRDPEMFMRNVPKDFNVKKADGTVMTWDSLYENQKARMKAIKHIDRLIVTIRVDSVWEADAVVLSTQDWSRVVPGPDGKDVRMVTGVTHREVWKKSDGQWKRLSFSEENPTRQVAPDASIKDPVERYGVIVKLEDERPAR